MSWGSSDHDHRGEYAEDGHSHREIDEERWDREREIDRARSDLDYRINEVRSELGSSREELWAALDEEGRERIEAAKRTDDAIVALGEQVADLARLLATTNQFLAEHYEEAPGD